MVANIEQLHHFHVNIDAGELPGISYTKDLTVTFVQRNGALDDRINVGDKILAVNDCSVTDRNTFDRIQQKHHITKITISRNKERGEKIKQEQCVDDKEITKRDGFLYLKVKMTKQHKTEIPIGLQVKNSKEGYVYVTHVMNGSLSAECLMVGDRILQVDGININDKEMAKKIIIQGLSSGNVIIVVERPDSPKTRSFASEVLSIRTPPNAEKSQ
ncbi:PDZ domain (Also known as DHR or GLGF) family protein [Acanthocheilonema viteae]